MTAKKQVTSEVDSVFERVRGLKKYAPLCDDTIRHAVSEEAAVSKSRDLEARVRKKLHRIASFYLRGPERTFREKLRCAFESADPAQIEAVCREVLASHASSRERLDHLAETYDVLFRATGVPGVIFDLAAAVHPFALRWMKLPAAVRYHAFELNRDIVDLINFYFSLEGINGAAHLQDLLVTPPVGAADLALFLKTYHCVEKIKRGSGWKILSSVKASCIAVSFPVANLHGRPRAFTAAYRPYIADRCRELGWALRDVSTTDEDFVIIDRK